MKLKLFVTLTFITIGLTAQITEMGAFGTNPGNLKCFTYKPPIADSTKKPLPLVIALHGCTQSAEVIANASGWNDLAKYYGFHVIYPQQKFLNNPSFCFNWFEYKDVSRNLGEVASVHQMVEAYKRLHPIDTTKIFIYGVSSGGALTVAYMANFPNEITAGAALAGGPFGYTINALEGMEMMIDPPNLAASRLGDFIRQVNPNYTGKYPKMLVLHGLRDNTVDPRNGALVVKQWANIHNADTMATTSERGYVNNSAITLDTYTANGDWVVKHYKMDNIGHALPVDPGPAPKKGGLVGMFAKDLDFFSTYYIAKDFGLAN